MLAEMSEARPECLDSTCEFKCHYVCKKAPDDVAAFAQSEVTRTLNQLREGVDKAWWENTRRAKHTTKLEVLALIDKEKP